MKKYSFMWTKIHDKDCKGSLSISGDIERWLIKCYSSGVTSDLKDLANALVEHIKLGSKWEPSIKKANPNFWFPQRLTSKQLCVPPRVLLLRRDTKDFPTLNCVQWRTRGTSKTFSEMQSWHIWGQEGSGGTQMEQMVWFTRGDCSDEPCVCPF